ncbi:heat shock transcription factor 2 [Calycina marina]|uniref:Transcription factor SKN7 n=1 Tax=Calycina marina TaxID=1763456 RepID=A0A9P7Z5V6_9HELO|nr:heat shock transcription factor 2 [Calycina marina]
MNKGDEMAGPAANNSSDFVRKLYKMLEDPSYDSIVRWGADGESFVVLENEKFTKTILPKHFKHSNFASFVRQLNKYDFHKVRQSNEENIPSQYGPNAWEFKHPEFQADKKENLDNIRRKAPAPRKVAQSREDGALVPAGQLDMLNSQLIATQQQLQIVTTRCQDLTDGHVILLAQVVQLQKFVKNHNAVMKNVMGFLHSVDEQRRSNSVGGSFGVGGPSINAEQIKTEDHTASPLQHASKLLEDLPAETLPDQELERMNREFHMCDGNATPILDPLFTSGSGMVPRPQPPRHTAHQYPVVNDLDNLVYPVGHTNGIDPINSEHINNIPYSLPPNGGMAHMVEMPEDIPEQVPPTVGGRKQKLQVEHIWGVTKPRILLVEDDKLCAAIGSKFLQAFECGVEIARDGLEAVNKINNGANQFDLILMDIIMPHLDGVSATVCIREIRTNVPIIAMTSNIRADDIDISQEPRADTAIGMNDVLPKPFTRDGMKRALEKHLPQFRIIVDPIPGMAHPVQTNQFAQSHLHQSHTPLGLNVGQLSASQSLKDETSPGKSPAAASSWHSPSQLPGPSPIGGAPAFMQHQSPASYMSADPSFSGMPPRGQHPQHRRVLSDMSGPSEENPDLKRQRMYPGPGGEDTLQAVILADSFETRFHPFTLERPRCLLPLVNTPLIENTLQFLDSSNVDQIFIYCSDEVEAYLEKTRWFPRLGILKSNARSVGDVLRDLDNRALITGDFLLVYGDLLATVEIAEPLRRHRERRIKDKNAVMTMILKEGGAGRHRTKDQGITPVFLVDPTKDRCLHFEEMHPLQTNLYVDIPPELLSDHPEMEIRADLIDCGIDICTPDVLALWSESFDYEVPRRHFLHGVLKDYELNGKTIHTEIVSEGYAARVQNLQAYDAVAKDILGSWTFPLVPGSNLLEDQSYKSSRGICKEDGVVLSWTCKLQKRSVIGRGTSVGADSVISHSTIGRNCQIGKNVTIRNGSHLWDNVSVGDNTTIDHAIIANEAVIGRNCTVSEGALISYSVVLGDSQTVGPGKRITRAKQPRTDIPGSPLSRQPSEPSIVGPNGHGYLLPDDEDEFEDESIAQLSSGLVYSTAHLNLSDASISTLATNASDSYGGDNEPRSRTVSFNSISDDETGMTNHEGFHHDAVQGIFDTLSTDGDMDAAKLELMGLRLGNNATDHAVTRSLAVAFSKRLSQLVDNGMGAATAVTNTFSQRGVKRFLQDSAVGKTASLADRVDFMTCLQRDLSHRKSGAVILNFTCRALYQSEVFGREPEDLEKTFLEWWKAADGGGEEMKKVLVETREFIEWLEESDDEDDDDSSEEEG